MWLQLQCVACKDAGVKFDSISTMQSIINDFKMTDGSEICVAEMRTGSVRKCQIGDGAFDIAVLTTILEDVVTIDVKQSGVDQERPRILNTKTMSTGLLSGKSTSCISPEAEEVCCCCAVAAVSGSVGFCLRGKREILASGADGCK
mmetsp:Transcript_45022/g.90236  ORF Transcript_45022/g.90236 Transcript_45022/m.90236 type:complete len:146 (-) Transcript_45022:9-446(-)